MKDKENKIIIYSAPDKGVEIEMKLDQETIWMTQKQIAGLFDVNIPAVNRHINNIINTAELDKRVISKMEITAADGKKYNTNFYNLDAIISVGYRVNSKKATEFRVWATTTLRKFLVDGYAINQKRLAEQEHKLLEIQKTVALIQEKSKHEELSGHERELLDIISEYTKSLVLLNKYDSNDLQIGKVNRYLKYQLTLDEYLEIKNSIREALIKRREVGELFGQERDGKMKAIAGAISQTFDGQELYDSIEEKAAHLLYFTIKDHPFHDGNKRLGSVFFIYFLSRNNYLYKSNGEAKINDNAMVALALLIAVSNPSEKDNIIKLIINLIRE